jgi:hypothetical protein
MKNLTDHRAIRLELVSRLQVAVQVPLEVVVVTVEIRGRHGGDEGRSRLRKDHLETARNVKVFEIQEIRLQRLRQEVEIKNISVRVEIQI